MHHHALKFRLRAERVSRSRHYYHRQKERPPLQPPGHRCVAASASHLSDSELRLATHRCLGACGGDVFSMIVPQMPPEPLVFFSLFGRTLAVQTCCYSTSVWLVQQSVLSSQISLGLSTSVQPVHLSVFISLQTVWLEQQHSSVG